MKGYLPLENYIKKQENTHFMYSTAWREFEKVTTFTSPHYLGLVNDENDIIAATLLLEESLPLNCSNLYAPRGFIIDYNEKSILKEWLNGKNFIHK